MARSRPHITLCAAISIDGKLATRTGDSKLSSIRDMRRVHKLRSCTDAILVGQKTVRADDPLLTVRHVRGKNPTRIIISSRGTIPPRSKLLQSAKKIPTIIACSKLTTKKTQKKLQDFGAQVIICGNRSVNLKSLLRLLYKKNITSILLEGGGYTNWQFIKNNLVDEIIVTITPYVVGGKYSVTLIDGMGFAKTSSVRFKLQKAHRLEHEITLHYTK